jgi:hypothetical protein
MKIYIGIDNGSQNTPGGQTYDRLLNKSADMGGHKQTS